MSLKQSIRVAIIFQVISLIWSVALNLGLIEWIHNVGLVLNLAVSGSMILFLIKLYHNLKD